MRFRCVTVFLALILVWSGSAAAAVLWSQGDYDGIQGASDATNATRSQKVFEDFVVDSAYWNVTSVFTPAIVTLSTSAPTGAGWEIRTGISEGNSGTLIDSGLAGEGEFSWSDTGIDWDNGRDIYDVYSLEIGGLNVDLPTGVYWLTLFPVWPGSDWANIGTTSGANSVGLAGPDVARIWNPPLGYNYTAYADLTFAMGLEGTAVPEPVSALLVLCGGLAFAFRRSRL